jgi:hypothetical protein
MNIVKILCKEESKLLAVKDKVTSRLVSLRAAISALSGNGRKSFHKKVKRHLSAAHKKAIREGIAKRRKIHAAA